MKVFFLPFLAAAVLAAPFIAPASPSDVIRAGESFARQQTGSTVDYILAKNWGITAELFPFETMEGDSWRYAAWSAWPSGFFAGVLWHFAEATGEPAWEARARQFTGALAGWTTRLYDHDIGFNLLSSFGRGYAITGTDDDRAALVTGAGNFSARHWMPAVQSLWSFNFNWNARIDPLGSLRVKGPIRQRQNVIIDTSMNIELLFKGARLGGDAELYQRGLSHMRNVVRDMVRPDGGTIQVVDYHLADTTVGDVVHPAGSLRGAYAWQGFSNASTWSRGQGWALHGLATAYRETGDPVILEGLLRVADFYLRETPPDGVPPWDYNAPQITDQGWLDYYAEKNSLASDSSAAAIAAAGLLQLAVLLDDEPLRRRYFDKAETILVTLSTPVALGGHLAAGTRHESILAGGTYSFPGYGKGLVWGDFYYVQAIQRHREITRPPARWGDDPAAGDARRWGWAPAHAWTVRRHAGRPAMGTVHGRYARGIGGRARAVALFDTPLQGDFTFSVAVASAENLAVRGDASALVLFNWTDELNYHYIRLSAAAGSSGLYRVAGGGETLLIAVAEPQLQDYGWRTVTLARAGASHTVSVGGETLLAFEADAPAAGGLAGLGSDGHSAFFSGPQLAADLPADSYTGEAGSADLIHYLLGADDEHAALPLVIRPVAGDPGALEAAWSFRIRPDYHLVLEQSSDLAEWRPVDVLPMRSLPDASGRRIARHPLGSADGAFLRLRVVEGAVD